ncbi:hypothetical protein QLX08_002050 [Tetragonisca angustula]|uniref:Uncharacterized protein n=1 Tax=Tetragonisca angustula TaxID=166442 RepID=A0AAW1ACT3_9HYME
MATGSINSSTVVEASAEHRRPMQPSKDSPNDWAAPENARESNARRNGVQRLLKIPLAFRKAEIHPNTYVCLKKETLTSYAGEARSARSFFRG